MIEIIGHALSQWDVGRSVQITGIEADHAHFANKGDSKAVIMGVADTNAKIPDYLLQTGKQLCVYAVKDGITVESKTFYVQKRERPENYVYEDDQRNYIYELIASAETAVEDATKAADSANEAADNANAAAKAFGDIGKNFVKTVNGVAPDENGNVVVEVPEGGSGGGLTTEIVTALGEMFSNVLYDSNSRYKEAFAQFKAATGYKALYRITNALTNVSTSNKAETVYENEAFKTTLTAFDNFNIYSVTVVMNGVDITSECYSDGVISIDSVIGDIKITALGTIASLVDTTIVLEQEDFGLNRLGNAVAFTGAGISKSYEIGDGDLTDFTNQNDPTMSNVTGCIPYGGITFNSSNTRVILYDSSDTAIYYSANNAGASNPCSIYNSESGKAGGLGAFTKVGSADGTPAKVKFTVFKDHIDDSYAYFTNTGKVLFAGVNTPYYGMANIDGTYAV